MHVQRLALLLLAAVVCIVAQRDELPEVNGEGHLLAESPGITEGTESAQLAKFVQSANDANNALLQFVEQLSKNSSTNADDAPEPANATNEPVPSAVTANATGADGSQEPSNAALESAQPGATANPIGKKTSSPNEQCPWKSGEEKLGWAKQDAKGRPMQWKEGEWAEHPRPESFGAYAASAPPVLYQVNHPACPEQCAAREVTTGETSEDTMKKDTMKVPQGSQRIATAAVVGGTEYTCVLAETGEARCFGNDGSAKVVSHPPSRHRFTSIATFMFTKGGYNGYAFACGALHGVGGVKCWGSQAYSLSESPLEAFMPSEVASAGLSSLSIGTFMICGILRQSNRVTCWFATEDKIASYVVAANKDAPQIAFSSVVVGKTKSGTGNDWASEFVCGIALETHELHCWGMDGHPYSGLSIRTKMCDGLAWCDGYTAGARVPLETAYSPDSNTTVAANEYKGIIEDSKQFTGKAFSSISVTRGQRVLGNGGKEFAHACGVLRDNKRAVCWGADDQRQASGYATFRDEEFSSVYAEYPGMTCGLLHGTGYLRCWGSEAVRTPLRCNGHSYTKGFAYQLCARSLKGSGLEGSLCDTAFATISIGTDTLQKDCSAHFCGLLKGSLKILCRGQGIRNEYGQASPPYEVRHMLMKVEPSCLTQHPDKSGPASCTSCREPAHHTIIDPGTNTGTCTLKECPFCKPKACCGPNHKHYVVNTESLEGVCVRHTDDCTPACVPKGDDEPWRQRVCSKGCHQLIKASKPINSTHKARVATGAGTDDDIEAKTSNIVVCQAEKQVVCPGIPDGQTQASSVECRAWKEVKPVAVCNFSVGIWNLGGESHVVVKLPSAELSVCCCQVPAFSTSSLGTTSHNALMHPPAVPKPFPMSGAALAMTLSIVSPSLQTSLFSMSTHLSAKSRKSGGYVVWATSNSKQQMRKDVALNITCVPKHVERARQNRMQRAKTCTRCRIKVPRR